MVQRWRLRQAPWPSMTREIEDMRRRFDEDFARPFMRAVWERVPSEMKDWSPSVDIIEQGENYIAEIELPGLKQEDFDVSVNDDTLIIKGTKKTKDGLKDEAYYRREIPYGTFSRSVALPSSVDSSRIDAAYEDGILRITLPRAAAAKSRKIPVSVRKEG